MEPLREGSRSLPVAVLWAALAAGCIEGPAGRPIGQRCEADEDCREGLVCRFGACRASCLVGRDCGAPHLCVAGVCLGEGDLEVTCLDIHEALPELPSGEATTLVAGEPRTVHCDMEGEGGGWARVVDLDAGRDPCPGEWMAPADRGIEADDVAPVACVGSPRACWASNSVSARFDPPQTSYREVRGHALGYQWASTDGFAVAEWATGRIDEAYVEGLSITAGGAPRRHVWTFVAALDAEPGAASCPCLWDGSNVPGFVGDDYLCESANPDRWGADYRIWFLDEPLWDEDALGPGCERGPAPRWFHRDLGAETTEPLEARILMDGCDEDVAVARLVLFVR